MAQITKDRMVMFETEKNGSKVGLRVRVQDAVQREKTAQKSDEEVQV